jgi:hypothetical protein
MSDPATTVYNLPEGSSTGYALRQRAYDRAIAEGMWTPDGRLETAISQAATIPATIQHIPAWKVLFGLEIRTTVAQFAFKPEWDQVRSRSIFEAPSLGGFQKRAADRKKIEDMLTALGPKASAEETLAGLRITAAIEQTEADNRNILAARNQMASMIAA